jgi:hypothetical protein
MKDDHGMTVVSETDAVAGTASARIRWDRARLSAAIVIRKGTQ